MDVAMGATPLPLESDDPDEDSIRSMMNLDETSMAEAQYDPTRSTATALPALSASGFVDRLSPDGSVPLEMFQAEPSQPLREALERGDEQGALQAYRDLVGDGLQPDLEPPLEARLARLLDSNGAPQDAVQACQRAARKDPQGPLAAGAILAAARILAERLGDTQQAIRLLQYLEQTYPDSPVRPQVSQLLAQLLGR